MMLFLALVSGIAYGSVYIGKKKNVNFKKLVLLSFVVILLCVN